MVDGRRRGRRRHGYRAFPSIRGLPSGKVIKTVALLGRLAPRTRLSWWSPAWGQVTGYPLRPHEFSEVIDSVHGGCAFYMDTPPVYRERRGADRHGLPRGTLRG